MELIYTVLFFIYGLLFGSFYNVVALRLPKGESLLAPPSHCPTCKQRLRVADLIPVVSYLILRGRCRTCNDKISPLYPLMELVTGLLFAFSYVTFGFTKELIVALFFVSLLVIITVSDIAYMLILNKVLLFFGVILAIARIVSPLTPSWDSLLGAFVGFTLLYFIAVVSKGGMGGGDIKLFFVIGIVLGTVKTLLTLFFASIIGMVIGVIILIKTGKGRKTPIPFGPPIAIAAVIVYFFGEEMISLYKDVLL